MQGIWRELQRQDNVRVLCFNVGCAHESTSHGPTVYRVLSRYSALLALDYASLRETVRNGGPQAKPRSRSRKPYFEPQDGGGSFLGLSPARKPSRRSPVRGESRQDLVNIDGIHTIDPPTHRRSHRGSKVSHKRDKKTRRPSKPKRASKSESSDSNDRVNGSRQQRSDSDSDSDNNSGSDKSNRSSSAPPRANRREMALPNVRVTVN